MNRAGAGDYPGLIESLANAVNPPLIDFKWKSNIAGLKVGTSVHFDANMPYSVKVGFLWLKAKAVTVVELGSNTLDRGAEVIALSFSTIGSMYQSIKLTYYTTLLAEYSQWIAPTAYKLALSKDMDGIDALHLPETLWYIFGGGKDRSGKDVECLRTDWKEKHRLKALGSVCCGIADATTTIAVAGALGIIDIAKKARQIGDFRVFGVAPFAVVKSLSLVVVARVMVVSGSVFLFAHAYKIAQSGPEHKFVGTMKMAASFVEAAGQISLLCGTGGAFPLIMAGLSAAFTLTSHVYPKMSTKEVR
jgi:hypothetical protein